MILERKAPYYIIKTILDYSFSLFCLIILIPVILILTIAILAFGKGPVIYTQNRIGKGGIPFKLYKFRSMHNGTEDGVPLINGKNDKRITSLGRFMRKHKLDEIPNFVNVLKGDMSIVGIRPEQQFFIDQLISRNPDYKLLQGIKPGITSWGQVRYGYAENVDQMLKRLEYDLHYFRHRSLWFDMKVAFYTIGIIIRGEGV
ncbi:MAG: sugar transferase [Bacteroidales bacterium]|nr:sugar transferase [Bacteroidales bacterium]